MEDEKFLTRLLMTVFGFILLLFVTSQIVGGIKGIKNTTRLKDEAIQVIAEIDYRTYDREKNKMRYSITYVINGKEYYETIKLNNKNLKEGDKIYVYYLPPDEDKIYLTNENQTFKRIIALILYCMFLFPMAFLGYICIKNYNVFKYRRTIDVR